MEKTLSRRKFGKIALATGLGLILNSHANPQDPGSVEQTKKIPVISKDYHADRLTDIRDDLWGISDLTLGDNQDLYFLKTTGDGTEAVCKWFPEKDDKRAIFYPFDSPDKDYRRFLTSNNSGEVTLYERSGKRELIVMRKIGGKSVKFVTSLPFLKDGETNEVTCVTSNPHDNNLYFSLRSSSGNKVYKYDSASGDLKKAGLEYKDLICFDQKGTMYGLDLESLSRTDPTITLETKNSLDKIRIQESNRLPLKNVKPRRMVYSPFNKSVILANENSILGIDMTTGKTTPIVVLSNPDYSIKGLCTNSKDRSIYFSVVIKNQKEPALYAAYDGSLGVIFCLRKN